MRRIALITLAALVVLAATVVALGLDARAARLVVGLQHDYQNALGRILRALRAGEAGAVLSFLGICFSYGFLHALGPGHGKALIAAYGLASGTALRRMTALAALAALGQATVAILVIYAGVWAYRGARDRVEGLALLIEPLAMLLVAGLGAMLLWRGLRALQSAVFATSAVPHHAHGHDHVHDAHCGCGHAHAPDPASLEQAPRLRESAALVLGIALRPCTGALFLLILTWRLGIDALGIFGAYIMGFGTFLVTALAAALAVGLRRGLLTQLPALTGTARVLAGVQLLAGAVLLVFGLTTALRLF